MKHVRNLRWYVFLALTSLTAAHERLETLGGDGLHREATWNFEHTEAPKTANHKKTHPRSTQWFKNDLQSFAFHCPGGKEKVTRILYVGLAAFLFYTWHVVVVLPTQLAICRDSRFCSLNAWLETRNLRWFVLGWLNEFGLYHCFCLNTNIAELHVIFCSKIIHDLHGPVKMYKWAAEINHHP